MTKEEIFEDKKVDVTNILKLSIVKVAEDGDLDALEETLEYLIDILQQEIEAIKNVDEFLRLQALLFKD